MAQVIGRKLVKLISPAHLPLVYNDFHCYSAVDLNNIDYARYPLFKHVHIEEVLLGPGDLLFLPVGWWHHVTSLDVTVTLTFTNFRWSNHFCAVLQVIRSDLISGASFQLARIKQTDQ